MPNARPDGALAHILVDPFEEARPEEKSDHAGGHGTQANGAAASLPQNVAGREPKIERQHLDKPTRTLRERSAGFHWRQILARLTDSRLRRTARKEALPWKPRSRSGSLRKLYRGR